MITRIQSVLVATPVADPGKIFLVHYVKLGDVLFWCGYTNGHDGQGWSADESEAMTFATYSAASAERKVAKRWHPKMRVTMRGDWMPR